MSMKVVPCAMLAGGCIGTVIGATLGMGTYVNNKNNYGTRSTFEHTVYMTSDVVGTAAIGAAVGATFPISVPVITMYKYQKEQNST